MCEKLIEAGRLKALPGTPTCVGCSRAVAKVKADIDIAESDQEDLINTSQNSGD